MITPIDAIFNEEEDDATEDDQDVLNSDCFTLRE